MFANLKSFAFVPSTDVPSFRLVKIDRSDLHGDPFPYCDDGLMLRVLCVMIESSSIGKTSDKPRVERTVKMQNIGADIKTDNIRDHRGQGTQSGPVFVSCFGCDLRSIFPTNDMYQHKTIFSQTL